MRGSTERSVSELARQVSTREPVGDPPTTRCSLCHDHCDASSGGVPRVHGAGSADRHGARPHACTYASVAPVGYFDREDSTAKLASSAEVLFPQSRSPFDEPLAFDPGREAVDGGRAQALDVGHRPKEPVVEGAELRVVGGGAAGGGGGLAGGGGWWRGRGGRRCCGRGGDRLQGSRDGAGCGGPRARTSRHHRRATHECGRARGSVHAFLLLVPPRACARAPMARNDRSTHAPSAGTGPPDYRPPPCAQVAGCTGSRSRPRSSAGADWVIELVDKRSAPAAA